MQANLNALADYTSAPERYRRKRLHFFRRAHRDRRERYDRYQPGISGMTAQLPPPPEE